MLSVCPLEEKLALTNASVCYWALFSVWCSSLRLFVTRVRFNIILALYIYIYLYTSWRHRTRRDAHIHVWFMCRIYIHMGKNSLRNLFHFSFFSIFFFFFLVIYFLLWVNFIWLVWLEDTLMMMLMIVIYMLVKDLIVNRD